MAIMTPDGEAVDVAKLNQEFARSQLDLPTEEVAPAPPKRAAQPRTATRPATKSTRTTVKKEPSKVISAPAPASTKLHDKRKEAGSDILHQFALASEVAHAVTGDEAWHKDAEVYVAAADTFGEACAGLAEKSPAFARYLDADGGSTAGAYLMFGLVSAQIGLAVVDNHNARGKIPGFISKATLYTRLATKKILKSKKK